MSKTRHSPGLPYDRDFDVGLKHGRRDECFSSSFVREIPLATHIYDDPVPIRLYPTKYPINGSSSGYPGALGRFKHLGCGI